VDSVFLTKEEAAKVLGIHVVTVFRMIARGELRAIRRGRFIGVFEEDVLALQSAKSDNGQDRLAGVSIEPDVLARHQVELHTLRHEVNQLLRLVDARRDTLRGSNLEMIALYRTASDFSERGWSPYAEEVWVHNFLSLSSNNFRQLENATIDPHPWRPFMRLANTMLLRPYNHELREQLCAARDHVEQMVGVWFEMKGLSPRLLGRMLREDASPSQRLLTRLEKGQRRLAAIE
jgi:excisionase family DNA binding protein